MGKEVLRIEWDGLKEFDNLFKDMGQELFDIIEEEYTQYGLLVEEGTKALVQRDTGDLEQSINFGKATREGVTVTVEGGSNLKYALIQHERPPGGQKRDKYDNGAKFEGYYKGGLGERTRQKPSWRGYRPGPKFLQNTINATNKEYKEMNQRILRRTLGGGRND